MTPFADSTAADLEMPAALQRRLGPLVSALLDRKGEGVAVKDLASGCYVHASEHLLQAWGRAAADVLGHTDADIFGAVDAAVLRAADQAALAHGEPLSTDHRLDWNGARRELSVLRAVTPPDSSGQRWLASLWVDQSVARQRDHQLRQALEQIEQQQRALEDLRREVADQALRDPASGLYTRAHFDEQLRREVDLSMREHREFAIVFAELGPPQARAQALGSSGERATLAAMGRLLRGGTRAMDSGCRWDERRFAVLLSGVGLATAHSRMESLRRRCEHEIIVHEGQEFGFTVAMGVASFPHTAQTQADLVASCEAALAEALRRGGNVVTLAAIRLAAH